ncbi:Alpha-mannosidase G [Smittium mucronatum]|uniref:Alpha-mannosidase n=1 Tax=Smittium mucronatum TaxID=133383 RepID=A0A1R0GL89_9FUNG|nr:Alpha-mannosidase G [Smittium mucronatum]
MFSSTGYNDTSLQKHQSITRERLRNFIHSGRWNSADVFSVLWEKEENSKDFIKLEVWSPPDLQRPTFDTAIKNEFSPTEVGQSFGPSWSTHWFKINIKVPDSFVGKKIYFLFDPDCEALVWSSEGEPIQGLTGGGGDIRRIEHLLTNNSEKNQEFNFYIEISCNGLSGNGIGLIGPADENRYFELKKASIGVKNDEAWQFHYDLITIVDMAHHCGSDTPRGIGALYIANQMVNTFDLSSPEDSIRKARKLADEFLSIRPGEGAHNVFSIGNCHIDTAWLWMYDETKRKVARSFSTQLRLMDLYPEYKFAASQAQQFEWLKSTHNSLFNRIRKYVKTGQFILVGGTWVEMDCNLPSGESLVRQFLLGQRFFQEHFGVTSKLFWLPDTFGYAAQIPQIVKQTGGEFFFTQKLSWNNINSFPNTTFNWCGLDGSSILSHMAPANTYTGNAEVGQVVSSVKNHKDLSSHNSSMYLYGHGDGGGGPNEGMIESIRRMSNTDGMPKIKHCDPTEFYESVKKTARSLPSWHGELYFELHRGTYTSQSNNKKANRKCEYLLRSVEYLSVSALVSNNFDNSLGFIYPQQELERLWKLLCLNQFHDVIPGSSINEVYRDSDKMYIDIMDSAYSLIRNALLYLSTSKPNLCNFSSPFDFINERYSDDGRVVQFSSDSDNLPLVEYKDGCQPPNQDPDWEKVPRDQPVLILNECGWSRSGVVVATGLPTSSPHCKQVLKSRISLFADTISDTAIPIERPVVLAQSVPGTGFAILNSENGNSNHISSSNSTSSVRCEGKNFILENSFTRATFNSTGQLISLVDLESNRDFVPMGQTGNNFVVYPDVPLFWDAWDVEVYYLENPHVIKEVAVEIFDQGPLVSSLLITVKISETSSLQQWVSLDATSSILNFETEVSWDESHKLLKVEFSWAIKSTQASYETQYGYISRPTHRNTSWDLAKFEVCGHKYADLSEYGAGVTLFNDCKYGFSCFGNLMGISLLRAPKSPDDKCDIGCHSFKYGVFTHNTSFPDPNVVRKAYEFNNDLKAIVFADESIIKSKEIAGIKGFDRPIFSITNSDSVILDTIKLAEPELQSMVDWEVINSETEKINTDKYKNRRFVVLRLYESCGGLTTASFNTSLDIKSVFKANMLENIQSEYHYDDELKCYRIEFNAFEIITLMLEIQ